MGRRQTVCSTTPTCKFHLRPPSFAKFPLRLRTYLMYTTAAIMSIGVLFDILVVYYAKFVQPYLFQLFNFDSETWTSSRKQWWKQSRMRWTQLTLSHCKFSPNLQPSIVNRIPRSTFSYCFLCAKDKALSGMPKTDLICQRVCSR